MAEGWRKFEKRQAVRAIDVARVAGVSQSAVSRVFRGGSVAPQRRTEILRVAKALGYRPDAMARAIITRRSGIVGILMNSGTNLYYPDVLTALCRAVSMQKLRAMVFAVESNADIDEAVEQALAYRVDGVVVLTDITVEHAEALSRLGSILVHYNREIEGPSGNYVGCDHERDGEMLGRHVAAKDATTFWILEGPATSSLAARRLAGLVRGLHSSPAQISVQHDTGDFSFKSGFNVIARRLAAGEDAPHAIIAVNDMMAIGAAEALRAAGRAPSSEILIAGFDGIAAANWPSFQITTMAQPFEQLAAAAIAIVVARLQDDSDSVER